VLVVGASSGIGRGIALALAQAGAVVAAAGRRVRALEELCEELGPDHVAVECDVRAPDACETTVDRTVAALGGLDDLVYAAGVSRLMPLINADSDLWHEVLETNVIGASLACRAAFPRLRASAGRAVFLGSSSVGRLFPGLSAYAASKAALNELICGWRTENPDVSFTNVIVGPTTGTEFTSQWDPDLATQRFRFWERHGYLSVAASMDPSDIGDVVCAAMTSPAWMWSVAVHACDSAAEPAIR
jgi:NAD(P)-dependent dehydrogenase (short-subunit alcohol dehydrogenase family)